MRPVASLLLVALLPRAASADDIAFRADADPPILAAAAFAWLSGELLQPTLIGHPTCAPCRASDLNPIDRPFAGRRDAVSDGASWGLLAALLVAPLIGDGVLAARAHAGRAFLEDLGVYAEVLVADGALNQWIKVAVQRPRPLAYDPTLPADARSSSESYVSFYSEHSSLAFAAVAATVTTWALRHSGRGGRAAIALVGLALAGSVAVLRVAAGKHFPTDVAAGALAGTAVGVVVPLAHRRGGGPRFSISPTPNGALASLTLAY
jgi:membrane-associated phospholipid phosphatase